MDQALGGEFSRGEKPFTVDLAPGNSGSLPDEHAQVHRARDRGTSAVSQTLGGEFSRGDDLAPGNSGPLLDEHAPGAVEQRTPSRWGEHSRGSEIMITIARPSGRRSWSLEAANQLPRKVTGLVD